MSQSHPFMTSQEPPNPATNAPRIGTFGLGSVERAAKPYDPNTTAMLNAVNVRAIVGSTGMPMHRTISACPAPFNGGFHWWRR